jgi:hypothetical protein
MSSNHHFKRMLHKASVFPATPDPMTRIFSAIPVISSV